MKRIILLLLIIFLLNTNIISLAALVELEIYSENYNNQVIPSADDQKDTVKIQERMTALGFLQYSSAIDSYSRFHCESNTSSGITGDKLLRINGDLSHNGVLKKNFDEINLYPDNQKDYIVVFETDFGIDNPPAISGYRGTIFKLTPTDDYNNPFVAIKIGVTTNTANTIKYKVSTLNGTTETDFYTSTTVFTGTTMHKLRFELQMKKDGVINRALNVYLDNQLIGSNLAIKNTTATTIGSLFLGLEYFTQKFDNLRFYSKYTVPDPVVANVLQEDFNNCNDILDAGLEMNNSNAIISEDNNTFLINKFVDISPIDTGGIVKKFDTIHLTSPTDGTSDFKSTIEFDVKGDSEYSILDVDHSAVATLKLSENIKEINAVPFVTSNIDFQNEWHRIKLDFIVMKDSIEKKEMNLYIDDILVAQNVLYVGNNISAFQATSNNQFGFDNLKIFTVGGIVNLVSKSQLLNEIRLAEKKYSEFSQNEGINIGQYLSSVLKEYLQLLETTEALYLNDNTSQNQINDAKLTLSSKAPTPNTIDYAKGGELMAYDFENSLQSPFSGTTNIMHKDGVGINNVLRIRSTDSEIYIPETRILDISSGGIFAKEGSNAQLNISFDIMFDNLVEYGKKVEFLIGKPDFSDTYQLTHFGFDGSKKRIYVYSYKNGSNSAEGYTEFDSSIPLDDGKWHRIGISYTITGQAGLDVLYNITVDGETVMTARNHRVLTSNATNSYSIGMMKIYNNSPLSMPIYIDNFRVYKKNLDNQNPYLNKDKLIGKLRTTDSLLKKATVGTGSNDYSQTAFNLFNEKYNSAKDIYNSAVVTQVQIDEKSMELENEIKLFLPNGMPLVFGIVLVTDSDTTQISSLIGKTKAVIKVPVTTTSVASNAEGMMIVGLYRKNSNFKNDQMIYKTMSNKVTLQANQQAELTAQIDLTGYGNLNECYIKVFLLDNLSNLNVLRVAQTFLKQ